jgi:hypothetical protein
MQNLRQSTSPRELFAPVVAGSAKGQMKRLKPNLDLIKNHWLDVPAKITPTSLTLSKDLSYEKWAEIGLRITRVKRFTGWALADWLNFGERKYGQVYTQAVARTGFQADYLAILKHVAANVDPSRRRENLSFTHHRLVASLEPKDQERFLSDAEENDWSQEELREAVRDFKLLQEPEPVIERRLPRDPPMIEPESYRETGEQILPTNRPSIENDFHHLLSLVKALLVAERGNLARGIEPDERQAVRLRESLACFIAKYEREERGE